ncbi:uncharacterized protein LOC124358139 [Homalodisca vitripennis]|uniref:uncharacterized protein LOC124358139 n=1 Tax=Homalodisca vitripennis TaxID=197043 RepID=UPI001EEBA6DC|nr:uncharacterized protein LOC124358139 [Homalodisca vitripennis]
MVETFSPSSKKRPSSVTRNQSWLQALPLVLLGIRNVYREDLTTSSAELAATRQTSRLQPVSGSAHSKPQTFVFQELSTCTHVFLRDDSVRRALQPPYSGPHKVLSRDDKTMTIQIADRSSKPQPRSAHTPVPSIGTPAADPDNATPDLLDNHRPIIGAVPEDCLTTALSGGNAEWASIWMRISPRGTATEITSPSLIVAL